MAHYAFLDANNIVVDVIVGKNEGMDGVDWETHYSAFRGLSCKRTSYNTYAGQHPNNTPFRKNYAGVGYTYDSQRDAFIPPQRYTSWVLDEQTCLWKAPTPMPTDGKQYKWDEPTTSWIEVTNV